MTLNAKTVVQTVADRHEVDAETLYGRSHIKSLATARHEAWLELRRHTYMSLPEIGRMFGRDHTTILLGVRRAAATKGVPVPPARPRPRPPRRRCKADGCRKVHRCKGWCQGHFYRVQTFGDPLTHIPLGEKRPEPRKRREERRRACEVCGGRPLGGGRWCGFGGCVSRGAAGVWSWSRRAA